MASTSRAERRQNARNRSTPATFRLISNIPPKRVAGFLATAVFATGIWYVKECRGQRRVALATFESAFASYRVQQERFAQVGAMYVDIEDGFISYLAIHDPDKGALAKKRDLLLSSLSEFVHECDKTKELKYQYQLALRALERAFSLSKWQYFRNADTGQWELITNEQHWCQMSRHNLAFMQQTSADDFVTRADIRSQMTVDHGQVKAQKRLATDELLQTLVADKQQTDELLSKLEKQEDRTLLSCWDCMVAFIRESEHPAQQDHP